MAVVKMHKASDGSLHESFEAYAKHEAGLKIKKAIGESALNLTSFFVNEDAGSDAKVLHEDDISTFVADNADALRNILNNSAVSRRGRKA